ncbi:MAG: glycoside hydrolase family 78 protein [Dysgonamonadaceae bacterium]|jgi:alpha-L-rhamnosidase|nr:glycoside hydrolase family 78 protein [Dysgonamonadaceae bacterium]
MIHLLKFKSFSICFLFISALFCCVPIKMQAAKFAVTNLRTDFLTNPVGIGHTTPRFSWEITAQGSDILQSAYQIRAALSEKDLLSGKNLIWDTKQKQSSESLFVTYEGAPLQSGQRVYWQLRVWDNKKNASPWSAAAFFETGLLSPDDWKASWIEPNLKENPLTMNPSPMLRKEFPVKKTIRSARIYITAHGVYQLRLNGKKVSEDLFTPGWTSYNKRLQYQVYDIASYLKTGDNAIGVILGDGWYRGFLAWEKNRNTYGTNLATIAQIHLIYTDNTEELILTDDSWKCATGPVVASDIYHGETYDARLEKNGWDSAGYNEAGWVNSIVKPLDKKVLIGSESVPVRIVKTLKPIQKITTPKGEQVFDMGQNMVGWIQFRLKGKAGSKITLKFAEILDKEGNFYTTNLRAAKVTDRYIFKGDATETYEPHFTFHGFRYVKIEDFEGEVTLDDLTGKVIHSDMRFTGSFECSDPLINQLQQNIQWGLRGNFLDVPTDCPQRDERLGWTADAQVFAPTACFNADAATFFTKWLKDLAADQRKDGAVSHVVPDIANVGFGSTGWADAAVIIPWDIYQIYGDVEVLRTQYPSMKAWVNFMRNETRKSGYIFNTGFHYGDWLAYSTNDSDYPGATTDKDLVATAYFARSTQLLQQTAAILGYTNDVADFGHLFSSIKQAFLKEFMTPAGRLASNTQTAYVLALSFDLVPENLKKQAAERLANDVKKFGHITTGFLGTPDICEILSGFGYTDLAYMLLFRKEYPSWLYPVTQGATTIWERWDGLKPDGTFQDPGMNSFNHYAYGAIGNWLYSRVAGIRNAAGSVGYKKILIEPSPNEKLSYAKAEFHSVYGLISSSWQQSDGHFHLQVAIPPNTTAEVRLPLINAGTVTEGGLPLEKRGLKATVDVINKRIVIPVGSGQYDFTVQ